MCALAYGLQNTKQYVISFYVFFSKEQMFPTSSRDVMRRGVCVQRDSGGELVRHQRSFAPLKNNLGHLPTAVPMKDVASLFLTAGAEIEK